MGTSKQITSYSTNKYSRINTNDKSTEILQTLNKVIRCKNTGQSVSKHRLNFTNKVTKMIQLVGLYQAAVTLRPNYSIYYILYTEYTDTH